MRKPPNGVSIMDAYLGRIDSDKLTVLGQHRLIFEDQRLAFGDGLLWKVGMIGLRSAVVDSRGCSREPCQRRGALQLARRRTRR
jgi:hypothetical protein